MRAKLDHIGIVMEKLLVKWAPDLWRYMMSQNHNELTAVLSTQVPKN